MEQIPTSSSVIFSDGYFAGRDGDPRSSNPHTTYSIAEAHWLVGWDEGFIKRSWVNAKPDSDAPAEG